MGELYQQQERSPKFNINWRVYQAYSAVAGARQPCSHVYRPIGLLQKLVWSLKINF